NERHALLLLRDRRRGRVEVEDDGVGKRHGVGRLPAEAGAPEADGELELVFGAVGVGESQGSGPGGGGNGGRRRARGGGRVGSGAGRLEGHYYSPAFSSAKSAIARSWSEPQ